jgi:hypothetical protein
VGVTVAGITTNNYYNGIYDLLLIKIWEEFKKIKIVQADIINFPGEPTKVHLFYTSQAGPMPYKL